MRQDGVIPHAVKIIKDTVPEMYVIKDSDVSAFFEAMLSDTYKFAEYFRKLLSAGIYIVPSQFETMFISTAHSEALLKHVLVALKNSLSGIFNIQKNC